MIFEYPIQVCIVDDNPDLLEVLEFYLDESDQFEVKTFTNGPDFLKHAESTKVHIAIIDVFMDEMEGDVVIEKLKEQNKGVSVILITGMTNLIKLTTCFEGGADDILLKPFEKMEFLSVLNARKDQLDRWVKAVNHHIASRKNNEKDA